MNSKTNSAKKPVPTASEIFKDVRTYKANIAKQALAIVDQFKQARELGLEAEALFQQIGFAPDDIEALAKFGDVLEGHRIDLVQHNVNFETMKALIETDDATRQLAIREIRSGVPHSRKSIENLKTELQGKHRSEREKLYQRGRDRLRSAVEDRIQRKARHLYSAMENFQSLAKGERRDAERLNIIKLATELLADFENLFEHKFVAMENWWFAGVDDELDRKYAEAHYALRELAAGNFDNQFPAVDPRHFGGPNFYLEALLPPWSAEESILFLAGDVR
ncbi:hypothetical protein [Rhizobium leguminosarum]|uniref:hypothetical protein n=1 Tax=Rhizobium leguminosarum TaxID=384 RepID=UPI0010316129|nr:hypothetical protein [Rhizobium leguminosarum]TAY13854.1 hypothetical protein ELH96_19780 [Rhizobium leguminosarum]